MRSPYGWCRRCLRPLWRDSCTYPSPPDYQLPGDPPPRRFLEGMFAMQFTITYKHDTDTLSASRANIQGVCYPVTVTEQLAVAISADGEVATFTIADFSCFVDYDQLWRILGNEAVDAVSDFQTAAVDRRTATQTSFAKTHTSAAEHRAVAALAAIQA